MSPDSETVMFTLLTPSSMNESIVQQWDRYLVLQNVFLITNAFLHIFICPHCYSMGLITKSLVSFCLSVCLSVCPRSYSRIFYLILLKFCTEVAQNVRMLVVCGHNLMTFSTNFGKNVN